MLGCYQVPGIWGDLRIELNADLFSGEHTSPSVAILNFCSWVIDRCEGAPHGKLDAADSHDAKSNPSRHGCSALVIAMCSPAA